MTNIEISKKLHETYKILAENELGKGERSYSEIMHDIWTDLSTIMSTLKDYGEIYDYVVVCNGINNSPLSRECKPFPACHVWVKINKDNPWQSHNLSSYNNKLYILMGPPGSGKSTRAKQLSYHVFEADNYWLNCVGDYLFVPSKIKNAHQWCKKEVEEALQNRISPICVANTSLTPKERQPYIDLAKQYRYEVELVLPDSPWFVEMLPRIRDKTFTKDDVRVLFEQNTHNVPFDTIENMLNRFDEDFTP